MYNVRFSRGRDWWLQCTSTERLGFYTGILEYSVTVIFHHRRKHCISQIKCWAYKCTVKVFFFYSSRKLQESIISGSQQKVAFSEEMSILSSTWFESPPELVERLPWTSTNFRSNLRWITVGQHLNSFYRYLLSNDLLIFSCKDVILCSDLPFTSVGALYINLAGSELSPYFMLLLMFTRQGFNSFLCLKSQVPSYSSVHYLSSFIPWTNPHLPLLPLLSWCLDSIHTHDKTVRLLAQVHQRPAQSDPKRLEMVPSSVCLAITFLLGALLPGKLSLTQTLLWLASVCRLGIPLKTRLSY